MSTALFENIIFGPVSSRRLGVSLGVNLLPQHGKLCDFDCIYCECGWNSQHREDNRLPSSEEVASALEGRLKAFAEEGKPLDTITFSANGEPTLHPDFPEIIDNTLRLRDKYCPKAKVSVLSNATMIWKPRVREALLKVDNPILKLDSPDIEVVRSVNRPQGEYSIETIVEGMEAFKGDFILQTIFFKGSGYDMLDPERVRRWYGIVRRVRPREIMMYTIDRDTPEHGLEKVSVEEMAKIAGPLEKEGFMVQIRG